VERSEDTRRGQEGPELPGSPYRRTTEPERGATIGPVRCATFEHWNEGPPYDCDMVPRDGRRRSLAVVARHWKAESDGCADYEERPKGRLSRLWSALLRWLGRDGRPAKSKRAIETARPDDIPRWWRSEGPKLEGVKVHRHGVVVRVHKGRRSLELFRRACEWRAQRWDGEKVGPSAKINDADHLVLLVRQWVAG
jgi:hypothetical protein